MINFIQIEAKQPEILPEILKRKAKKKDPKKKNSITKMLLKYIQKRSISLKAEINLIPK